MKRAVLVMLCLSTLPLLTSCQWLPGDSVVCTLYGDASCPEGTFCDPEPAGTDDDVDPLLVGEHLCTGSEPASYTPADDDDSAGDDDDTSVGDDDSAGDDDDDSSLGDDDSAGDDDDDSSAGDDDTPVGDDDDDDSNPEDYSWEMWEAFPEVADQALYGVSFPDGQTGCSQTPLGECHAWAVGTSGTVLHSANGGMSWNLQPIPPWQGDLNGVHFISPSTGWIVGDEGFLAWTPDGGTTWNQVTQFAATEDFNAVYATNSSNVYIVTSTGKVFLSSTGAQSNNGWTSPQNTPDSTALLSISGSPDSQPKVWTVGDSGVFLQAFGNNPPSTQMGLAGANHLYDVAVVNNEEGWIVGANGTLLYTDDHGVNWQPEDNEVETGYSGGYYPLYGVDFVSPERGWVVGGGTSIFRTTNSGFDWESEHNSFTTTIANFPNDWPWLYDVDFTNPSVGIAVGNNGLILYARPDQSATGDDDDLAGDDDDAAVNCDQDGDGFESTGSSCGGTDCRDGGPYAPFINPLAWDGNGDDGMSQSPADANCDGNFDHTEAEQTAFGIVPPASCADVDSKYVVGSGHGDFNGDTFEDLAFGNPSPTCGGNGGGRAVVLSSSETRGSVYGNGSTTQMNASTTARWVFQGPAGSETGHSVALGQFSSSSPGALLIGAPGVEMPGAGNLTATGAVYLVLQAPTSGACALPGTSGSPCADFTIYGATEHERAGETVAWAGDITLDGYQEILIGAPGYGSNGEGKFYLLDGQLIQTAMDNNETCTGPDGSSQPKCLNLWDLNSGATGHISIEGTQHAELGKVLPATGELDGSSRPDFVLSSASANAYSGAAYVFYGDNITSGSAPSISLDLSSSLSGGGGNQGSTADALRTIYPPTVNTEFGASISVVPTLNLSTDNHSELAIGAPAKNVNDGSVYIVKSEKINGGVNAITIDQTNSTELRGKPDSGERFGSTLAGGQLDGDSHGDLVVCAPLGGPPHSASYVTGAGTARLYRGVTINSLYSTNSSVVIATNDADVAFLGEVPDNPLRDGDRFCSSLNISVDADRAVNNNNDVVIAAHHWSPSSCTSGCGGQGKAYVFANPYIQGGGQP